MSFNEIQLPNQVLVDFYKVTLIAIDEKKQAAVNNDIPEQAILSKPLQYLGDNLRNTLVLVYYPQEKFLPDEQLNFLSTILNACNLNIADVAIVNVANSAETLDYFKQALRPKAILLFGNETLTVTGVPPLVDFNITDLGGILTVCSCSLESFNKNNNESKSLKRKLWECLKQLYNM